MEWTKSKTANFHLSCGKKYAYAYDRTTKSLLIDNVGLGVTLKIKDFDVAKQVVALIEK